MKPKYLINRFLSYYFLDFSISERLGLWRRLFAHEILRIREIRNVSLQKRNVHTVFVISLVKRLDRRAFISNRLHDKGIAFEFINGIEPHQVHSFSSLFSDRAFKNLTAGSKACACSHFSIWDRVAQRKDDNPVVVLEDDVLISDNFVNNFGALLIPAQFDILYFGSWNNRGRDRNFYASVNLFSSYNPRKGLYAYAITPESARRLLKVVFPMDIIFGGIDTVIGKFVRKKKLLAFQYDPTVIDVNFELPSDIYNPSQKNKKLYNDVDKS